MTLPPNPILVLPAAGRGTRMRGVAGNLPKELLPLEGKTVIDWAAEELPGARLGVASSPDKPLISAWAESRAASLAIQPHPNGFAPAIAPFLALGRPVALALPDTLYWPSSPLPRLLAQAGEADILIAVEEVPDDKVSRYGICEADPQGRLQRILEKPRPDQTASRWAISARYLFSGPASSWMAEWISDHLPEDGELSMTPVFNAALSHGWTGKIIPLLPNERRLDCGSPEGYREAQEALRGTLPT